VGEAIQQTKNQLNEWWQGKEEDKRKKIIIIFIISIISIIMLSIILSRPKYEVLYEDLSLKDMAQITKKLDELNVKWKTPGKDNTATILVPAEMKNKIKIELASYGLPKEMYGFTDAFNDSSWTMTDYDKKERYKYAKENELAATISDFDGVESAKVYIDLREDSGFVLEDNKMETTAAVSIIKSDNRPLKGETVTAIKDLVANSINTSPENIQVIDTTAGRTLGDEPEETEILMTDQFNIKNNLEQMINKNIKEFLENVFGANNVAVNSSIKINFDSEKSTIVEFAPPVEGSEEGLIRSMEEIEEHMVGGQASGTPGTETNPPDDYGMPEDGGERHDMIKRTINNELNEINKEIRKAPGQVEDITVAVLINRDDLSSEEEEKIADLIYAATGLDTKKVEVRAQTFDRPERVAEEEQRKNLLWLVLLLVALAIGTTTYVVYRRRKEEELRELRELEGLDDIAQIETEVEDLEFITEESKMKSQIEKLIDKNPEQVAQLLRTWLNE
jgi:flagellar M-ring protein FliF